MRTPFLTPVASYRARVSAAVFRSAANSAGKIRIGLGYWGADGCTSSSGVNPIIDLTTLTANAWTQVDFFVDYGPTGWPNMVCGIISTESMLVGGDAYVSMMSVEPTQITPGVPQKTASAAYVLQQQDSGKHIYISTGGVTLPNNSDVPLPIESIVTIVNNSGSTQTISKGGSVTMYLSGDSAAKTTLTLAARGMVTFLKVGTDTWMASGNVT